ncbi:TIGR04104 family putative zinc finger protein [Salinicoccus carnicancri]|uniref:TIGR04104 family putative zinc finger protein n=1 Tax=Salinicoccus carnicancri TaxID=558170 RepID=UPI0003710DDB|nr:TIGR04104 family putative zinc finger protein [Salinicoccus carnicancri]
MATCTNCETEWTFKDKAKKSASFSPAMPCPYCGADQFVSPSYRERSVSTTFIMTFVFFIPLFFNVPWQIHIPLAALTFITILIFQVSLLELHSREEYPF